MPKVLVPGNLIVPITARNLNCVEKIRDFVSNNRYSTGLLGMLSESMLSCEQRQPIRAFIQLGPKVEGKVDKSWQSSEDIKQEGSKNQGQHQMSLVTRKHVFGVCDQVRLKLACSATEPN